MSIALALALVVLVVSSACAQKPAPPPTPALKERELIFHDNVVLTGPMALSGALVCSGHVDGIKWVNETGIPVKGGVIKLKYVMYETGYVLDREIAGWQRAKAEGAWFVYSMGSPSAAAFAPMALNDKILNICTGEPAAIFGPEAAWSCCYNPIYADGMRAVVQWWYDNRFADKGKRVPRIGFIGIDSQYGWTGARSAKKFCELKGWEFGPMTWTSAAPVDVRTQIMALKEANVDLIWCHEVDQGHIMVGKTANELGLKATIVAQWLVQGKGVQDALGPAGKGILSHFPFAPYDSDAQGRVFWNNWLMGQYGLDGLIKRQDLTYDAGLATIPILAQAIKKAGEKVGIDELTPQHIRDAWKNELTGFTWDGFISPMVTTEDDGRAWTGTWVVELTGKSGERPMVVSKGWISPPDLTAEERNPDWWKGKP